VKSSTVGLEDIPAKPLPFYFCFQNAYGVAMRKRLCSTAIALCFVPVFAFAQIPLRTINDIRTTIPVEKISFDPEELADSILIFVPDADIPLHIPQDFDRTLKGRVVDVLKGVVPGEISVGADTLITDVKGGVPVKMFLMEHPERPDVYYPIAIFQIKEIAQ
jgi:hypothetical protein